MNIETLKKEAKEIGKLDDNRKFLLLTLFIVLFLISVFLGNKLARRSPSTAPQETVTPAEEVLAKPATNLALSPTDSQLKVGVEQVFSVSLSTVPVTAVDIVLNYDPTLFVVSDVRNGDVFAQLIRNRATNGVVTFSAAVDPADKDNLKEGTVMTFKVRALKAADNATFSFDPVKTITAIDGENTLGSTVGGTYTITN